MDEDAITIIRFRGTCSGAGSEQEIVGGRQESGRMNEGGDGKSQFRCNLLLMGSVMMEREIKR